MINGNTTATLQKSTTTKNDICESVKTWTTVQTINGWLDLSGGDSKYTTYNAKVQESTHIFIADYVAINASVKAENSRVLVDGVPYDVMLIDDPMGLHQQLEIYLKFTGGR